MFNQRRLLGLVPPRACLPSPDGRSRARIPFNNLVNVGVLSRGSMAAIEGPVRALRSGAALGLRAVGDRVPFHEDVAHARGRVDVDADARVADDVVDDHDVVAVAADGDAAVVADLVAPDDDEVVEGALEGQHRGLAEALIRREDL